MEYGRFGLVNVAGFIQVWIVSVALVRVVFPDMRFEWHAEEIAHLVGVVSPIAVSYYGHKHFFIQARRAEARRGDQQLRQALYPSAQWRARVLSMNCWEIQ